jgi:hypothetical protein
MIKKIIPLAASFMLVLPISISYAATPFCTTTGGTKTITSTAGDNDNLGRHSTSVDTCGCWNVTHDLSDGVFDLWDTSDKAWTHTFTPLTNKKIASATLTIYGFNIEDGTLKLFVDGVEVPGAFANTHSPTTSTTVINLDPTLYDKLKDGSVEVAVRQGSTNPSTYDAFAIDYAKIEIQYEDTGITLPWDGNAVDQLKKRLEGMALQLWEHRSDHGHLDKGQFIKDYINNHVKGNFYDED